MSVKSEIEVFRISNGDDGIWLVYMGLSCDLNSVLWTPWFTVPTLNVILCTIEAGTYIGDGDIGDQFHNFMLHPSFQSYAGLDFKHQQPPNILAISRHGMAPERSIFIVRPTLIVVE